MTLCEYSKKKSIEERACFFERSGSVKVSNKNKKWNTIRWLGIVKDSCLLLTIQIIYSDFMFINYWIMIYKYILFMRML